MTELIGIQLVPNTGSPYAIDGSGEEFISWHNVQGQPCHWIVPIESSESGHQGPTAPGIYRVTISDDGDAFRAYVTEYDVENVPLAYDVDGSVGSYISETGVTYDALDNIIPGLSIRLFPVLYDGDQFQVIIGGRWYEDEDRYLRGSLFGHRVCGSFSSDPVTIRITNNSGIDITQVSIRSCNRISLKRSGVLPETTAERVTESLYTSGQYPPRDGFDTHPDDVITRMTSCTTPAPCRVTASHELEDAWYPFSEDAAQPDGVWTYYAPGVPYQLCATSWQVWYDTDLDVLWEVEDDTDDSAIIYKLKTDAEDSMYLQYDFGFGNYKSINRIGIVGTGILSMKVYGSEENNDFPTAFELIKHIDAETVVCGTGCYESVGGPDWNAILYRYFHSLMNSKPYRHFRFVPTRIQVILYYSPSIARIELLDSDDEEVQGRDRPFSVAYQTSGFNPYDPGIREEHRISLDNINTESGTVDVRIDGDSYPILRISDDYQYSRGKSLPYTTGVEYMVGEGTPCEGLVFVINPDIGLCDYAMFMVGEGAKTFFYSDDGTRWLSNGETLYLLDEAVPEYLADGEYVDIAIKANPPSSVPGDEEIPTEGIIEIVCDTSEYENVDSIYAQDSDSGHWGISPGVYDISMAFRFSLGPFETRGDQVRLAFYLYEYAKIYEVFVGIGNPGYPDFTNEALKQGVPFSGEATGMEVEAGGTGVYYTEWVDFPMNYNVQLIVSISGYRLMSYYSGASPEPVPGSTFRKDYETSASESYPSGFSEYSDTAFLIQDISVRSRKKLKRYLPLQCSTRDSIPMISANTNVSSIATVDRLGRLGITFGTVP